MGLSRDVSWPPCFSVSCFLRCCLMHLVTRIMELRFNTTLTAVFNLRRLQAKTKVKTYHQWVSVRRCLCTSQCLENHMLSPTSLSRDNDWRLVEKFTCLGSTLSLLSWMTRWTPDSQNRVQPLANSTRICGIRGISKATKIKVYRAVVLTILLYGCETWTYQQHIKKLNHFHMTCLWKILGITWQKHIPQKQSFNSGFSSQHLHHLDAITTSLGWLCCPHERSLPPKETALQRAVSGQALLRRPEKILQTHWRFPWNLSVSPLIAWNIYCRTEIIGMKLSSMEWNQKKCSNLEKTLQHQPLPPPFLVFTAQDSSAHRLVSLAIYALTDAFLNHKVDQMVLIFLFMNLNKNSRLV